jgi:hypothetical protein
MLRDLLHFPAKRCWLLLPNGWRVTPAGEQVVLTDLPLNIVTSADSKYAFVATSGYNSHELTAVELATGRKAAVETVKQSWFGLARSADGGKLWWSGGGDGVIHTFAWDGTKLAPGEAIAPPTKPGEEKPTPAFRTGLVSTRKAARSIRLPSWPRAATSRLPGVMRRTNRAPAD